MATYDVVFTAAGITYNFMLVKDGKNKAWKVSDAPLLPASIITTEATPSNINPEREIQEIQEDWRRGFQDLMFDDERKYYSSENCDARLKGKVMLSPKKLTSLAYSTYNTIANADMELDSDWTGAAGSRSSEQAHGGTYSWRIQTFTGLVGTLTRRVYQEQPVFCAGEEYTFKCWVWASVIDTVTTKIGIDDGVSETLSADLGVASTWTQLTVTKTLSFGATKLRLVLFHESTEAGTFNSYFDDATLTPTALTFGSVPKIITFGTDVVVASGAILCKLYSGSFEAVAKFGATITDLCVFENRLYIAQGWSAAYYYTSDLITFTESTLSANTAKHMSTVADAFWISDTGNTLRDSDNPINGGTAFSTAYTLPNADYNITGLVDHIQTVFVRKQDQVYYLSEANVYSLIPELETEVNTSINYSLFQWKGCLYIPSGTNSLYEYDDGLITVLSLPGFARGDTAFDEEILAFASDTEYLYVAEKVTLTGDDQVEILAGRWETIAGTSDWAWHPIYEITSNAITAMLITNVSGDKRLYAGTGTYGDGIYPFIVPVSYADPLSESGHEVQASGDFITPWFRSNFGAENKYWHSIKVTSICVINTTHVNVYVQRQKDTAWKLLGECVDRALVSGAYPPELSEDFRVDRQVYEQYNRSDGCGIIYPSVLQAQTFTPTSSHTVKGIKLRLNQPVRRKGTLTVSLRATSASKPTGSDLASGTLHAGKIVLATEEQNGRWYYIDFDTSYNVADSTEYAIVAKLTETTEDHTIYWRRHETSPTYAGGQACTSEDGTTWTAYPGKDFCFGEYAELNTLTPRIRFKFALTTDNDNYSPILCGLGGGICVKAILQFERKKQIDATVLVAAKYRLRDDTIASVALATNLDYLRTLYALGQAMTVTGPDDTVYSVMLDKDGYVEQLTYDEEVEHNECYWVSLKMREV